MQVEIVEGNLDVGEPSPRRYRYAYRDGKRVRIRMIDATGPSLDADLLDLFRENVRRARRENRAVLKKQL